MSNAQHTAGPWFVAAFGLNKVATITNVTSKKDLESSKSLIRLVI